MARCRLSVLMVWSIFACLTAYSVEPERVNSERDLRFARDQALHQTANEQARRGDPLAALRTIATIAHPQVLAQAIVDIGESVGQASQGDQRVPLQPGGRGGAIDFGPLMNLIQTTIAPDTWEEAGGPSTIAPYAAGIVVDPTGLVSDITHRKSDDDLLENIAVMLSRDDPELGNVDDAKRAAVAAWRLPSAIRCVSLRSLTQEVARRRLMGELVDDELRYTAGLSRIRYVVNDPGNDDVILVGPVGGIESHQGWMRDRQTGAVPIRIDFLAACLIAVLSGQPLGCTIDPTPQSLATAAEVSDGIRGGKIATGIADEALRDALGDQVVRVFGLPGDTPLAYLMVEVDRHMKRLSLGIETMPQGVENYLDVVRRHIRKGPPDGQLLRLWFTASPVVVRVSGTGDVFELGGRPMKLQSETQIAGAKGDRLASPADFRLVEFVDGFNRNLDDVARKYPAYAALESVYHSAAVAELVRRSNAAPRLGEWLVPLLLDDATGGVLQTPRRVASIAVGHSIRQGSRSHFLVLASGGVTIHPEDTIQAKYEPYPSHDQVASKTLGQRHDPSKWWWDVQ